MDGRDELRGRFKVSIPNQVVPQEQLPMSAGPQPTSAMNEKRRSTGRKKVFLLVMLSLAVILTSVWYAFFRQDDPTPASVKGNVTTVSLFYPSKLPENFVLDKKSYSNSAGIVSFHAANDKGQKILFTIQPRPDTFDYQTFYQKGLSSTEQFSTAYGQAAIGLAQTRLMGSLVSDKTWVIVSSDTDKIGKEELKLVLSNLKLSDN